MTHQNTQVVQEVFDRLQASCEAHIAEAAALQALALGRTSGSLSPRRKLIEAVAREFGDFPGGSSPSRIFQPATPQRSPGEWELPPAPCSSESAEGRHTFRQHEALPRVAPWLSNSSAAWWQPVSASLSEQAALLLPISQSFSSSRASHADEFLHSRSRMQLSKALVVLREADNQSAVHFRRYMRWSAGAAQLRAAGSTDQSSPNMLGLFRRTSSEVSLASRSGGGGRRQPSMMRRAQQGFAGQGRGIQARHPTWSMNAVHRWYIT